MLNFSAARKAVIALAVTTAAVMRGNRNNGDESQLFTATANATNCVQALETDGFQVGTNGLVNTAASTFYYAAFKGVPAAARPPDLPASHRGKRPPRSSASASSI
jgi:hypothetical protein